jgi:hypothetical protein
MRDLKEEERQLKALFPRIMTAKYLVELLRGTTVYAIQQEDWNELMETLNSCRSDKI